MTTSNNWITVSRPAPNRLRFQRLRLAVVDGPDAGRVVDFSTEVVRVGTLARNDLALTDRGVSALHFELEVVSGGLRLRDPGSTNGTTVDGVRVRDAFLHDHAQIKVGHSVLQLTSLRDSDELTLGYSDSLGRMVGASAPMQELYSRLKILAASRAPVLISGETGCGKEVAARALHDEGENPSAPFVVVTCPAMPSQLVESELFGYERGAFTGAERTVAGAFEQAGHGTILLDELGDMPLSAQPKLLGVLERRRVRRIGSREDRPIHARVVAATNRDLAKAVARGAFRADLYYRLGVGSLRVPPLRERTSDIPLLVEHFLRELPGAPPLTGEMLKTLIRHPWPGNVRELRNAVQRIAVLGNPSLADHSVSVEDDADTSTRLQIAFDRPYGEARSLLLDEFRRRYVKHALEQSHGNVAQAARSAGVDRMTLYRVMKGGTGQ